jgi:omega-amidase
MAEEILRILLIQPDIVWNNAPENLRRYSAMLQSYDQPVDLVLLPEMFTTGFITTPEDVLENMQEEAVSWMKKTAAQRNCSIAGSLVIAEDHKYYNRLIYINALSEIDHYNKRHLFQMEGEEENYTRGTQRTISIFNGWRICWQICYDLRFPVWSRNQGDYDVLVYSANWPAQRSDVWNTLLRARAIENQAYVIGVNRVGEDENDIVYLGESMVVDPIGNVLNGINAGEEKLISVELNYPSLLDFRNKFPVLMDADKYNILG